MKRRKIVITRIIDDYNHWTWGVDIARQRIAITIQIFSGVATGCGWWYSSSISIETTLSSFTKHFQKPHRATLNSAQNIHARYDSTSSLPSQCAFISLEEEPVKVLRHSYQNDSEDLFSNGAIQRLKRVRFCMKKTGNSRNVPDTATQHPPRNNHQQAARVPIMRMNLVRLLEQTSRRQNERTKSKGACSAVQLLRCTFV